MAIPTRPVQDAIIDPVWGQWVHDDTARTITMKWATYTGTTDAWGFLSIPPSFFGLATVTGGAASTANDLASAQYTRMIGDVIARGTALLVRVLVCDLPVNNVDTVVNTAGVSVHVFAWGTAP